MWPFSIIVKIDFKYQVIFFNVYYTNMYMAQISKEFQV